MTQSADLLKAIVCFGYTSSLGLSRISKSTSKICKTHYMASFCSLSMMNKNNNFYEKWQSRRRGNIIVKNSFYVLRLEKKFIRKRPYKLWEDDCMSIIY